MATKHPTYYSNGNTREELNLSLLLFNIFAILPKAVAAQPTFPSLFDKELRKIGRERGRTTPPPLHTA